MGRPYRPNQLPCHVLSTAKGKPSFALSCRPWYDVCYIVALFADSQRNVAKPSKSLNSCKADVSFPEHCSSESLASCGPFSRPAWGPSNDMRPSYAFVPSAPTRLLSRPGPGLQNPRQRSFKLSAAPSVAPVPDAGLISAPGTTGTACTNLWPIPIFGSYAWFLNVYDRKVAAEHGAFVADVSRNAERIALSFSSPDVRSNSDQSYRHRAFRGIAAGNINVASRLRELGAPDGPYRLKFFEAGSRETFLQRRNEVHSLASDAQQTVSTSDYAALWEDPAPTFTVISRVSSFEVRQLYSGAQAKPRRPSKFEYFAMNLFPIFPLADYSCYVCVWKQGAGTSPVAIDKRKGSVLLSFFDPQQVPSFSDQGDVPPPIGKFAVKTFFGAITDKAASAQHKSLLRAIAASPSISAFSDKDYRIIVDNTPNTLTGNRRNELWVQVV